MELTLELREDIVAVTCNGQPSHTFMLHALTPTSGGPPQPLDDPRAYGEAVFAALFPQGSQARLALDSWPERLLLVALDDTLDAIPWEYAHGPDGFLVLDLPFVRGLPPAQRIAQPTLDTGLHIVAVPSDPLDPAVDPLEIESEWQRLAEIIGAMPAALTLERVRPATLAQLRATVAGVGQRIVHFMGHGGRSEGGAFLCFEEDDGSLAPATAQEFVRRVRGSVFLVTLNACVSATPGATPFSNIAASLVRQRVPYALGMRFSIADADARAFSRVLYSDLARGIPVEEAVQQARAELAASPRIWAVGVPVLYTALAARAPGFTQRDGVPRVDDPLDRVRRQLGPLPRAEGGFRGRDGELRELGQFLTGDARPRVINIHGSGGQGKTALARVAAERFAWAWPGGVWAVSLENLPSCEQFVGDLARFLGLDPAQIPDQDEVERQVLARLGQQRTLLILDNAETLADAVEMGNGEAQRLAQLIREQLPGPRVTLLITSRVLLGWPGEETISLGGLADDDGAQLFRQSAPQRRDDIALAQATSLSRKVGGHPLSLRLLGGAFNDVPPAITLVAFTADHEARLLAAENRYLGADHRHRTLYASIETSVRYLDDDQRTLLGGLWIFHAPFHPETAVAIFDPDGEYPEGQHSPILGRLDVLWRRSLLAREMATLREGRMLLYRLLPTVRPYAARYIPQAVERAELLARFGAAHASIVRTIYRELDRNTTLVYLAQQTREDLERGITTVSIELHPAYALHWGWVVGRLGDRRHALELLEIALEEAEGGEQSLVVSAMNNMAGMYQAIGQPQRALTLFEQVLPIMRAVGNRAGEAATLNNMALVYQAIGQPQRALALFEQALPIRREVDDRAGEAATLNNMALVYQAIGQPQRALTLFEQALPITREVGNRAGEASALIGLAYLFVSLGRFSEALAMFEDAIALEREGGHRAGEIAGLIGVAHLLYLNLDRPGDAISNLEQAIAIFIQTNLSQDADGRTQAQVRALLVEMRAGRTLGEAPNRPATLPEEQLRMIITNTIAVMTTVPQQRREWRGKIANALAKAQQQGSNWQIEVELFTTLLSLLDGQAVALPEGHAYSAALATIQQGIARHRSAASEPAVMIDESIVADSVTALRGTSKEKFTYAQRLAVLATQSDNAQVKLLATTIQRALFGGDPSGLAAQLKGDSKQTWDAIVAALRSPKGEAAS